MPDEIHIDDLASPQLSEIQQAALAYGDTLTVELNRESILAEAEAKTGMSDWGPDDFLSRLDLLCDEWDSDKGLSGIGRLSLRNKLLQHATSRLLIQNQFNRHPEIHDIQIEKPIIVAGLPRSGTTHLLNLMASDPRLRALPLWESYEPVPLPNEALLADGTDPRYKRCADTWETMQAMTPHLAAMHPMNPDHIHEELELMGPNFGSYNYEWLCHSPRWRDSYYAQDQTYQYEYLRDVLKLLTWQQRGSGRPTRWVLKCPQHLEQLPVLHRVFPDATVAITHRDPVSVIQSAATMLGYGSRMSYRTPDPEWYLEYWHDRVRRLLESSVQDRHRLPTDRTIDVLFHEFMADDMATIEQIYELAGLPLTNEARQQIDAYRTAHPRGKDGQVVYELRADFGTTPEELRGAFDFYFDKFAVRKEVK